MFLITAAASWIVTLGGLVLAVARLALSGFDPITTLLALIGIAAMAGWAWFCTGQWSRRRQLCGRLHDLAMLRTLRPLAR
jgi:hypothetical protein